MEASVVAMLLARGINGILNFTAAGFMYRQGTPQAALRYNSYVAFAGTMTFLFVSIVGIAGVAGRMDPVKLGLTILGILLIELGTR
jgi:hypothetical protein